MLGGWQGSKNPGQFLGKWNRQTETRKLHKAKQVKFTLNLRNLEPATENQELTAPNQAHSKASGLYLSSLTKEYLT